MEDLTQISYPPVAAEGQIHRQGEDILHKLLIDLEEAVELLIGDAESQQDTDGHAEGELLSLMVDIDRLRIAAPGPKSVFDHQLDLGEIALQCLMAEDFGENLQKRANRGFYAVPTPHSLPSVVTSFCPPKRMPQISYAEQMSSSRIHHPESPIPKTAAKKVDGEISADPHYNHHKP